MGIFNWTDPGAMADVPQLQELGVWNGERTVSGAEWVDSLVEEYRHSVVKAEKLDMEEEKANVQQLTRALERAKQRLAFCRKQQGKALARLPTKEALTALTIPLLAARLPAYVGCLAEMPAEDKQHKMLDRDLQVYVLLDLGLALSKQQQHV